MLALALSSPGVLNDGDSFLHLATGEWMISHRAVLHTDPFSFSRPNAPWLSHEWLAEILMAEAFRLQGWAGVVALTALAAALALFQLARHLGRWLPPGANLFVLLLAGVCVAPGLLARPHILALPVFEAWVAELFVARSLGRAPSWFLLPLMCLWANLHGGFILGLLLVVPLTLEAILAAPAAWRAVLARWGGFLLAAVGAALLTPHGLAGLVFSFELMGMPELSAIGEWRPADFGTLQPQELALIAGLYVALTRGARLPRLRVFILLGLLHMALQHTRQQMFAGVIVPLLIAEPLGAALPASRHEHHPRRWSAAGAALAVALVALRLQFPIIRTDSPSAPIRAVQHVPPALTAQPVFNDYFFGGYLIFVHIRPFIDGRADMYGSAFLRQYLTITRPDKVALETAFRTYGIGWTILMPSNPAVGLLDALPHWCRLYADGVAVVHARCAGRPK
ncbi:MAG TPA: hypothetical protein VNH44_00130 [Micropepsaceae bacterium]|nr:hypothetical protein [Micropepsaceae bacterium]